ncbi:MAG: efflux RND transporter periplasmic adaptor subunit, partial [Candidatus Omnitrophica bacterium]|nr:efflux RND transporter periplasmic adaptor subunit [Candidatus Omnitrophota bacterium]
VSLEDVSRTLEYVGDIKGQDEAIVYPKVTGKIIEKVKEEGDTVAKGDPIAYIDRDEVGLKFEKAPVEAPLSGRIGRIYVDIGSSVTMQTPIALVADMDKAEIYLKVPETYLPSIRIGQKAIVRVDAYPKEEFLGYVQNISPVIDLQTRSAPIEIVIDNPDHRLQSGMFAKVSLIIEEHRQNPAILKEAVIGRIEPFYVYVVEDGKARLRQVRLGARRGAYVEVIDGLKVGESVVIMGQQKLRDGASVTAEE